MIGAKRITFNFMIGLLILRLWERCLQGKVLRLLVLFVVFQTGSSISMVGVSWRFGLPPAAFASVSPLILLRKRALDP